MGKYAIWDKKSDIYTLGVDAKSGKAHWTAEEYIRDFAPWAAIPNAKAIIGGGLINGTVFMEFNNAKEAYISMGAKITDDMTDDEVLAAMEAFEKSSATSTTPTTEERTAAALEALVLTSMPDSTTTSTTSN
jgi:hypothetical protein